MEAWGGEASMTGEAGSNDGDCDLAMDMEG